MHPSLPAEPQFGEALPIGDGSAPVLNFLARRRSASAATLRAPGPDAAQLHDLLRLAARVPDHGKLSPWRFIVLEGEAKAAFVARLEAIAAAGAEPEKATGARRPSGARSVAQRIAACRASRSFIRSQGCQRHRAAFVNTPRPPNKSK